MTATFSFNTWNHSARWGLPPTLPDQIAAAAGAGYQYVGLDVPSLLAHEEQGLHPEQIRDCLKGSAIGCFELVPLPISSETTPTEEGLEKVSRLAPVLGARQVLAVVQGPVTRGVVTEVRRCTERLAELGIGTSIEFLPSLEVNSIDAVRRLIDAVEHPQLRIVVDSWHFFAGPDTWATLDAIPAERLGFVQFSDAVPATSDDVVHQYCHCRVLPGQGIHDLHGFSQRVLRRWPGVVVSVEVLSSWWRSRPVERFAVETFRATQGFWRVDKQ
ncbi:MAG TPA: TIM barrel protein [Acidimicrobiales bacterium]|nr:TIM barrel protein [Acidimicrobiales bacterium]